MKPKEQIMIMASKDIKLFRDTFKISFYKNFTVTIPIIVGIGDFWNPDTLFKTSITIKLKETKEFEEIKKMEELFSSLNLKKLLNEYNPKLLNTLLEKAEKILSKEKIKPVIFKTGEFLEVDNDTSFCGNYKLNNKEGVYMDYGKKFGRLQVYICGNDDMSYTKNFDTITEMNKEVERLRRCQPISMDFDVLGTDYYFSN